MVQNVRAYILDRQEQMQRIVSYISFQRIPGEQPGIFCVAEVCASEAVRNTQSGIFFGGETFCGNTASK